MDTENKQKLEHVQFEQLIQGLLLNQYGCIDNFMDANTIAGLRNNIHQLSKIEDLKFAGLGKEIDFQKNILIRGDKIKWIEKDSIDFFEILFLKKLSNFITYLNETCFTSINNFESHYANYEQKSFYKKHLDQFKNDKGRKYSVILYLNYKWLKKDGGLLSLYPNGSETINISPIGGRFVFFKSDVLEHEVHPSFTKDRISIAGWLKSLKVC